MTPKLREAPPGINKAQAQSPQPAEVRAALDEVRPGLLVDGGNVELGSVDPDGTVRLMLQGACVRCPSAQMTVRRVIEPILRARVPSITGILVD
jgi:Fe-S cluster biogenesis protein NfuA